MLDSGDRGSRSFVFAAYTGRFELVEACGSSFDASSRRRVDELATGDFNFNGEDNKGGRGIAESMDDGCMRVEEEEESD